MDLITNLKFKVLKKTLEEELNRQQDKTLIGKDFILRPSSAGNCSRKLKYIQTKTPTDTLLEYRQAKDKDQYILDNLDLARGQLVFSLGHLIEQQIGDILGDELTDKQLEVKATIGQHEFIGHIDGIYNNTLIDVKSTNERSFKNYAIKKIIDLKYIYQAHIYMYALNKDKFEFIYYDKNTSKLCSVMLYYDKIVIDKIKIKYDNIFNASKPEDIQREYDIFGKVDAWVCGYCGYKSQCYPGLVENNDKGKRTYSKGE